MRHIVFGSVLTLILILGLGCDNNSTSPIDGDGAMWLVKTPDGGNRLPNGVEPGTLPPSNLFNDEATDLATWWSGELFAPHDLKHEIATELRTIRLKYSKTIPSTNIEFMTVNVTGQILFSFTDAGWEMWKNGTYNAWDSLNTALKVDSIVVATYYPEQLKCVKIFFPGRPNVDRLKEFYEVLPEVKYAEGDAWCCDWPILLMWREDDITHYFFRKAWGDCPSGCINQDFYYFTVVDGEPTYIGHYLKDWDHPEQRPDWMAIADMASNKYWTY